MKHKTAARRVRRATVPLALALAAVTGITILLTRAPTLHIGLDLFESRSHQGQQAQQSQTLAQPSGLDLTGSIFVSISSYRDDECSYTVQHMFAQADVPERVYAGVCEQNWRLRESCKTGHLPLKLRNNVQYVSVNASEAKGPTYGRALAQKLSDGQDYYMQIDSHTQFAAGWDRRLIEMYEKLRSCVPRPVLSHYPPSSEDLNDKEVPRICNVTFLDDVQVWRLWEAENQLPLGQFVPTPFAAAGFMFFAGDALKEVPFDPQLPYLFDGEETLYSVRLWTHGWDIFTPIENLIFHHYERKKAKSVYADHEQDWWPEEQRTLVKVRYMLNISSVYPNETFVETMESHGLGDSRTLAQFYEFANVDIASNTSYAGKKFCGPANSRPPTQCLERVSLPIDEEKLKQQIRDYQESQVEQALPQEEQSLGPDDEAEPAESEAEDSQADEGAPDSEARAAKETAVDFAASSAAVVGAAAADVTGDPADHPLPSGAGSEQRR